ncbi:MULTISPECIES: ABC transporter permease [unclassified Aureispira]|uniref:ABC transporter permease n=1 Tax=unclassified Aureispira TaxID=2649989 RepID=UPI000698F47D|nr:MULTISPECIES: ABC transporter permease [unclassified Aureispira]WMX13561.1 ABC transporter permease [Aureispira sp. CCB-E]
MNTLLLLPRIFFESIRQAFQQLAGNKLRTLLSLSGITIGIFCVIMVLSAVDSLEANIQDSFKQLGDDVIYISKMPWGEPPHEGNFWKYQRRPETDYRDYEVIAEQVQTADIATFTVFIGNGTAESKTSNASNVFFIGVTDHYKDMFGLKFSKGRYFTPLEFYKGTNHIIIGHDVAETLFRPTEDPIGKYIKVKGQRLQVIGVLEKEGKDLINPLDFDGAGLIPYNTARKYVNLKKAGFNRGRTSISVKAKEGVRLETLQAELTGVLRAKRLLKPVEEDNFSLNTLSIVSQIFENVFGIIRIAGYIIGFFAIIVGGFSVANIMFVSVTERTRLIGIKKALGAKNYVILMEFLVESIILCLIGGVVGLVFVILGAEAATSIAEYDIFLSPANAIRGLLIASASGVIAGIIPAYRASKMVPVEAIRG